MVFAVGLGIQELLVLLAGGLFLAGVVASAVVLIFLLARRRAAPGRLAELEAENRRLHEELGELKKARP